MIIQIILVLLNLKASCLAHIVLGVVVPDHVLSTDVTNLDLGTLQLRLFELWEKSLIIEHYQKIKI
jgi:hypothetical protein